MPDVDFLELDPEQGTLLSYDDYASDFAARDREVHNRKTWKFERRQHFLERSSPSWEAFRRGEWDEALRLIEERRDRLTAEVREEEARGNPFCRVRVVDEPLTPYLQWELHSLRLQAECGRPIRVVDADAVRPWESAAALPEVVVVGGRTLYEVVYTSDGLVESAVRYTDTGLAERWERFIEGLYSDGEDVRSYVDRYVVRLPVPSAAE